MTKEDFARDIFKALKDIEADANREQEGEYAQPTSDIYSVEQYDSARSNRVFLDGTFDLEDLAERLLTELDILSA